MQKQQPKPHYNFVNAKAYPVVSELNFYKLPSEEALRQPSWRHFLEKSADFVGKWITNFKADYVLYEIDDNNQSVKFYENHKTVTFSNIFSQSKYTGYFTFHQIRKPYEFCSMGVKKNFVDGSFGTGLMFSKNFYSAESSSELTIDQIRFGGSILSYGKKLNPQISENSKKIFFENFFSLKPNAFKADSILVNLSVSNRHNFFNRSDKTVQFFNNENPVQKTSDLISMALVTRHAELGVKCKFEAGVDSFNRSAFGKFSAKYGNFVEYDKVVMEYLGRLGIIKGRNLLLNDLLNRNKTRWVSDRSDKFANGRVNLLFKNIHPIISGLVQALPYLYLEGWVSTSPQHRLTKCEVDYGIGIRFLKLEANVDLSLIRVGKNLSELSPGLKINFD